MKLKKKTVFQTTGTPILSSKIKFHSLFEHEGADQGMADMLACKYGWQDVPYELADVIVFNGGADIGTQIYGEHPIGRGIPEKPSPRDVKEMDIFYKYKGGDKLLVGICRGAQLLNCLNGGTLWQDVNNHGRSHMMTILASGQKMWITSTHHQMMRPHKSGQVLAVADCATYKYSDPDHWSAKGGALFADDHKDTEIVWYPATGSLCIQGHPEYVPGSEFADYCVDLMFHYLQEVQIKCAA
jgi:Peptidase C26